VESRAPLSGKLFRVHADDVRPNSGRGTTQVPLSEFLTPPAARKDKNGRARPDEKGIAYRAVERITDDLARSAAVDHLHSLAISANQITVRRGITYLYRENCGDTFPTREEFLVAAPAVVATKARHGLDWFDNKCDAPQGSLFE
jgi:hypothetical protein